jgi:hypothetical protein
MKKMRAILLMFVLATLGCVDPMGDSFRRRGGAAPDPTGVIEGTVLYTGARPECRRDEEGRPIAIIGNVVLTLFVFNNPPPPSGSATSPESLLTIPGHELFSLSDCMPAEPTAEDRRPILASAPFTWPALALSRVSCSEPDPDAPHCPGRDYQLRAFYDRDGDFNPFFSVRNLPTAGDVAGGALEGLDPARATPRRISFGHVDEHPNGELMPGVTVTLGAQIGMERSIFELDETTRALDSAARLPFDPDPIARERALFELTRMRVNAIVSEEMPNLKPAWAAAMDAAGMDSSNYRFGNRHYGFPVAPVDANLDGAIDSHPILGSAGLNWYAPIVIVRRARTPIEQELGLPEVRMIGSIRPSAMARRMLLDFEVIMAPIGVMITNPLAAACRTAIVTPGNLRESYEASWTDCQELPSGNYDVSVLSGLAGGVLVDEAERCNRECVDMGGTTAECRADCATEVPQITDTGFVVDGGALSGQAWSIPNELGCPDTEYRVSAVNQLDAPLPDGSFPACGDLQSVMLEGQGRAGGFAVVDTSNNAPAEAENATVTGHGIASCRMARSATSGEVEVVTYRMPPSPTCCPATLDQFCGLPLCARREPSDQHPGAVIPGAMGGRAIREIRVEGEDFVRNERGIVTPLCTPYLMPVECCRIAESRARPN